MIIHKAFNGLKTSASIDDELFSYVVRHFDDDPKVAKQELGKIIQEAVEANESPSQRIRMVAYRWIARPELLDDDDESFDDPDATELIHEQAKVELRRPEPDTESDALLERLMSLTQKRKE